MWKRSSRNEKFENGRRDHVQKKGKPCSHAVDSEETDYIYEYEINAMYEYECMKIIVIIAMVGCRAGECGAVPCRIFDFMAYKNYTNCLVAFVSLLIIVDLWISTVYCIHFLAVLFFTTHLFGYCVNTVKKYLFIRNETPKTRPIHRRAYAKLKHESKCASLSVLLLGLLILLYQPNIGFIYW